MSATTGVATLLAQRNDPFGGPPPPPIDLGNAEYGLPRPEIGAAYGAPQFTPSGFTMTVSTLPPGHYTLDIRARSAVTGLSESMFIDVRVQTNPRMNIDLPAHLSRPTSPFALGGWALDLGQPNPGTGVNLIHVWAYPAAGGTPIFVGEAGYGAVRPDVGAVFGSQFTNSGFYMTVSLTPGSFQLAVFARSALTNTFNQAQTVTIMTPPAVAVIDTPSANASVPQPSTVVGYALDPVASSGVGVNVVRVRLQGTWPGAEEFNLGDKPVNLARPDVAAIYGAQFTNCGWEAPFVQSYPPGEYDVKVTPFSTVTNTWEPTVIRRITILQPNP